MQFDDGFFMDLALQEAWRYQGLTHPNPAVGCAVVREGRLLAVEAHRRAGESHAEVRALMAAYEVLSGRKAPVSWEEAGAAHDFLRSLPGGFFSRCELFVTLEPCSHEGRTPSCARLIDALALRKVTIALEDPVPGHGGGAQILIGGGTEVEIGLRREGARDLIEPFLISRKRAFVLFKLAQTSNGRIGGGYLSCPESLEHVHRLREAADELLIGGGTVRVDRPRLDCRFTGAAAPDVTIYSRCDDFDREIPLFGIDGRRVSITDDLEPLLRRPGLLLVEGGEGMLRALRDRIDWLLLYQTPRLSTHPMGYSLEASLEFLHQRRIGRDLMIWSRFV